MTYRPMTYRNVLLYGTALVALSPLLPTAADAQASPSAFTAGMRYDAARRVTGTISPDPDGAGALPFRAVRNTYDAGGRPIRVERGTLSAWQSEAVAPASWSGFTILETVQSSYDNGNRKIRDIVSGGGTVYAVTDYSYDTLGRPRCTAVRMNPAIFPNAAGAGGSLPADACTAGTASTTYGPDRITRATRNWRGHVMRQETGVGTSERRDVATYNYDFDGNLQTITDANGNMSAFNYDGHDRMNYMFFPSATLPGEANGSDYEQYTLDEAGNRTVVRRRDGQVINHSYDALDRMTSKDPPGSEPTVIYGYDLLGRMTSAATPAYPSMGLTFTYDALGRRTGETGPLGTLALQYDAAGNRTRITYPDADYMTYVYNNLGEMTSLREPDNDEDAALAYDNLGRRVAVSYRGGSGTTYTYDGVSRLASLSHNLGGTANDVGVTFTRNPAGQIVTRTASNDAYGFTATATGYSDAHNGLNQIVTTGGTAVAHDARGNTTAIGVSSYGYDSENRLVSGPGGATFAYDPLGRLYQTAGPSGTRRFLYEGDELVAEYDGAGTLQGRYMHGPGTDDILVASVGGLRSLYADERGSIVAASDGAGNIVGTPVRYDDYGSPQGTLPVRFGYTGQAWLPEIGMWYYKARIFNSARGRFMQADPSGYADGPHIYGYAGGDPINASDPSGMFQVSSCAGDDRGGVSASCSGESALGAMIARADQALARVGTAAKDLSDAIAPENLAAHAISLLSLGDVSPEQALGDINEFFEAPLRNTADVLAAFPGGRAAGAAASTSGAVGRFISVEQRAAALAQRAGRGTVSVRSPSTTIRIDLRQGGRPHGGVPTPHTQRYRYHQDPVSGRGRRSPAGGATPTTAQELRIIRNYLRSIGVW